MPYYQLLPSLFHINAGYFLIQLASEPHREAVYKMIGEHIRRDAKGVKQVCVLRIWIPTLIRQEHQVAFIGVVNPLDPVVETPESIANELVLACKYISKDQLGATDDCGMHLLVFLFAFLIYPYI